MQTFPPTGPQPVANRPPNCSKTRQELSARDYSPLFRRNLILRFVATQSIRQTARDFSVPARTVNEILHLEHYGRLLRGNAA